jgi:hypothetical protein
MKAAVLEGIGKALVIKPVADPLPAPGFTVVRLVEARRRLETAGRFG